MGNRANTEFILDSLEKRVTDKTDEACNFIETELSKHNVPLEVQGRLSDLLKAIQWDVKHTSQNVLDTLK